MRSGAGVESEQAVARGSDGQEEDRMAVASATLLVVQLMDGVDLKEADVVRLDGRVQDGRAGTSRRIGRLGAIVIVIRVVGSQCGGSHAAHDGRIVVAAARA